MPRYGPWIQPPDRELAAAPFSAFWKTVVTDTGPTYEQTGDEEVYGVADTTLEISGEEIVLDETHREAFQEWVLGEGSISGGSDLGVPPFALFHASHASTMGLPGTDPDDPDDPTVWFDRHTVERGIQGSLFNTDLDSILWSDVWRADLPPDEQWPVDAVSYEVEMRDVGGVPTPASTILSAAAHIVGEVVTSGGTLESTELVMSATERWLTEGVKRLEWATEGTGGRFFRTYGGNGPVDVTMMIEGLDSDPVEAGIVAPVSLWGAIRTNPDATGGLVLLEDGLVAGDVTKEFQMNLDQTALVYTIRPPRIRWIYDSTPFRRTFPRDDILSGGAPRVFPPSMAVQSSNRVGGSYA